MPTERPDWTVLLIGGPSGVGKTMLAERLGKRYGTSWLQVDDLRLALQHSQVGLPSKVETAALHFFLRTSSVWQRPPERLRDALIAVGGAVSPAIEIVTIHHVDTSTPIIIEGDAILPSLLRRPVLAERVTTGRARAVFLIEPDEDVLYATITGRNRGIAERSEPELRVEARAAWLYGQWLADEARRGGLPVVAPRPWATLAERAVAALER